MVLLRDNKFYNTRFVKYIYYLKGKLDKFIFLSNLEKESKNTNELYSQDTFDINKNAEEILNDYGNTILRYAYSYLHNMSDAEEVLQETLIRYLRKNPKFNDDNHKKAWLLRVSGNLSKNKIAYNKIRNTNELNETLVGEERDDLSYLWDAVKSLPSKYSEVIHLYYHEGYSSKEIAIITSKNESTVRSNLKRGRDKLKLVLKENYDFEWKI